MNTIQYLEVLAARDVAGAQLRHADASGDNAAIAAAEIKYNAAVQALDAANAVTAGDLNVIVGVAINESQRANCTVKLYNSAGIDEALALACDDNCDGQGGNYWGENAEGAWRVLVEGEVES